MKAFRWMTMWETAIATACMFLVLSLVCCLPGCDSSSRATTVQERAEELDAGIKAFQALNLDGRVVIIWGTGHVAGQAFNLTGSSGFAEVIMKPLDEEQPAPPE